MPPPAEYAGLIRQHGAEKIRFVATSATRDAGNRQVFIDGIRDLLGVEPEVITGDEEAALSFAGASSVLPSRGPDPVLVVDLGGGSTEFVLGNADGVIAAKSVDIGCVRMTERHLRSDPPDGGADRRRGGRRRRRHQRGGTDRSAGPQPPPSSGWRVRSPPSPPTRFACRSTPPAAIHGSELAWRPSAAACTDLLEMTRAERAALPYMHPGRVDVIGAGALVWRRVLERLAEATEGRITTAVSSEHDILDGIALSIS